MLHAVSPGGHVIVATFAEDGPEKYSGLPVMRYSADGLHAQFRERLQVAGDQAKPRAGSTTDPLADTLSAVRAAAIAVGGVRYGKAPAKDVRGTRPYKLWAQLLDAVQGEGDGSLLRALQDEGYVKRRGGWEPLDVPLRHMDRSSSADSLTR